MGMTTMGVKLDDATRERIKTAATRIDRTPHWLIKQAVSYTHLRAHETGRNLVCRLLLEKKKKKKNKTR